MSDWHQFDTDRVLQHFQTTLDRGLDPSEVAIRQEQYGPNLLEGSDRIDRWKILLGQFTATLVVVLIAAAIASALLGDFQEAIAILIIVLLNACLGFTQEYRSEQAIAALKKLSIPSVQVRRDGRVLERSAKDLVPGDIVLLTAGGRVPADARLLESQNLQIAEAALTGESTPSDKAVRPLPLLTPIADRSNMAYAGTSVTHGRGTVAIVATGMNTELGKIAASIQLAQRVPTPLQERLDRLGKTLSAVIFVLVAIVFALGLLTGEELKSMFLTAVSLAVAAVPEGLPAVVTIALALGAQRMLKQRALIRNLPAVETLGSVTVICSDKTGTLTQNCMTVTHLELPNGNRCPLNATPDQNATHGGETDATLGWGLLLAAIALCNDAQFISDSDTEPSLAGSAEQHYKDGLPDVSSFDVTGDPTETALAIAAARSGAFKFDLDRLFPRVAEFPFESERKRMTTIHSLQGEEKPPHNLKPYIDWRTRLHCEHVAISKGSVEGLLTLCDRVWLGDRILPLTSGLRSSLTDSYEALSKQGNRVLGVAIRPLEMPPSLPFDRPDLVESDLVFIGIVGMADPLRPEAKEAVALCQRAGIRPVLITGDHPSTALNIAQQLGIATGDSAFTGQELDHHTDDLAKVAQSTSVFARVSPQNKLQLVQQLQSLGEIVAMTGDGINDAPALKMADIGVAMGETGTDVAKEAADMVLLRDNFNTIVLAIKEGRVIFDNIRKFIKFTLTGNCGELFAIAIAPFIGMPFLLRPLQILWINLLGDGLLALALSVEPAEDNVMNRPPYPPGESIWKRGVGRDIVWIGLILGLILLTVGFLYWNQARSEWQTMVFSTLAFSRIGLAQVLRSDRQSLISQGITSNQYLCLSTVVTFALQLVVMYWPPFQELFETRPLLWGDLAIALGCSLGLCGLVEWSKRIRTSLARTA
ncbi:MAG: cation-translocating P-type ATPase [Synechococcus sp.]